MNGGGSGIRRVETRITRPTNRHLHRLPSPWEESYCHNCDTAIRRGDAIYLDTNGGLFCSYYCSTAGPRPGCGGVQESVPSYEVGLCVTCADDLGLPPNVFIGGYSCGHCHHLHSLTRGEAIRMVWRGAEPEAVGLMECPQCNGYGSSLKEDCDRCSRCEGSGLVPLSWSRRLALGGYEPQE